MAKKGKSTFKRGKKRGSTTEREGVPSRPKRISRLTKGSTGARREKESRVIRKCLCLRGRTLRREGKTSFLPVGAYEGQI